MSEPLQPAGLPPFDARPRLDSALQAELERLRGTPLVFLTPAEAECREIRDEVRLCPRPRVSILVITYNHERFVGETLDSLVAQDAGFEYEIIVGEDRSPDGTMEAVKAYQARHPDKIRILHADRNVGATANSFRTIAAARGEYIAFCEGDDYWCDAHKLRKQAAALDAAPSAALCAGRAKVLDMDRGTCVLADAPRGVTPGLNGGRALYRGLLEERLWFYTPTTLVRRDAFTAMFARNPLLWARLWLGDTLSWMELLSRHDLVFLDEPLAVYRQHGGGVSNSPNKPRVHLDAALVRYYFADREGLENRKPALARRALQERLNLAAAGRDLRGYAAIMRDMVRRGLVPAWKGAGIVILQALGLKRAVSAVKGRLFPR